MKNAASYASLLLALLVMIVLLTVSVSGQQVSSTTIDFGDVLVAQTSKQVNVSFTNTGNSDLDLTISISGPFAIPVNHCGRGVKVGTHCNVDVTYTPEAVETDTGTLAFNFGEGTAAVSLTGTGVTSLSYSTKTKLTGPKGYFDIEEGLTLTFSATVTSKGGTISDGEQVNFYCDNSNGGGWRGALPGTIEGGVATIYPYVDQVGSWQCWAIYPGGQQGDVLFESSQSKYDNFHTYQVCCSVESTERKREE
jgi:hypothetical protein